MDVRQPIRLNLRLAEKLLGEEFLAENWRSCQFEMANPESIQRKAFQRAGFFLKIHLEDPLEDLFIRFTRRTS